MKLTAVERDTAVVTLDGELDVSNLALLDAVLLPLPGRGVRNLVVDAARLRFCDVCGWRTLESTDDILAASGGSLAIASPPPELRRLAEMMRELSSPADLPIKMYDSVDHALEETSGDLSRPYR
ncbi:STAS domain-containing protein [Nonomuraea recticatena]|uniref:STAS domain-containing protein n=1 Tax=Nonomuraea recticatena TaxID=46178 RepID=UPI0031F7E4CD